MTRLAALLTLAFAVLVLGSERSQLVEKARGASGIEVVVALQSPPPVRSITSSSVASGKARSSSSRNGCVLTHRS